MKRHPRVLKEQKGMALLVSILLLAAVAMIAISLSADTTLEMRLAGNQKATEIAFRNAEAGLEHARVVLASQFTTSPVNVAMIRAGQTPTWTFLFSSGVPPRTDPDWDSRYDEKLISLPSTSYKVFVRDPQDSGLPDGSVIDTDQTIIARSIGFGPGGARQMIEVRLKASASGSVSGYYAQQGGGPTKANVNLREQASVSNVKVETGTIK